MLKVIPLFLLSIFGLAANASVSSVKIKDIARFDGVRDNAIVGYGLVVGLAGSGDSNRSKFTIQSIKNTLENFDLIVSTNDIASRNVAAVMVTASLPPFAQAGDKLDVQVSSIGDAKSLVGGSLIVTPLKAVNGEVYALAQGALSVGGYQFEKYDNIAQKNHPTVGQVPHGATVEQSINNRFIKPDGSIHLLLNTPDFTTASRVVERLTALALPFNIEPIHASRIKLTPLTNSQKRADIFAYISTIENSVVNPASNAKVVINERTGTIVSGDNISIDSVVITQGSLKIAINTEFQVSQPENLFGRNVLGAETKVVPRTDISVDESNTALYVNNKPTNIADVVDGLLKMNLSTRDIISVLQALKKAGAMHAEIIIQ
ncbi:flagellar basal body P-ring protein FlgI [Colwellia sp. MEBiC06753]